MHSAAKYENECHLAIIWCSLYKVGEHILFLFNIIIQIEKKNDNSSKYGNTGNTGSEYFIRDTKIGFPTVISKNFRISIFGRVLPKSH